MSLNANKNERLLAIGKQSFVLSLSLPELLLCFRKNQQHHSCGGALSVYGLSVGGNLCG